MRALSVVGMLASPRAMDCSVHGGEPQFRYGVGHSGGDLMVAATRRGADSTVYDNKCRFRRVALQSTPQ